MTKRNRRQIYWLSQMGGWGLFVLGNILNAAIQEQPFQGLFIVSLFIFMTGIAISHIFRNIVHRLGWKRLNIPKLLPRMLLASLLMSLAFMLVNTMLTDLVNRNVPLVETVGTPAFWQNVFNFSALFLLWSIIYFAVNTFENWKREEINNLELRASKTEIELNSFKAQMNPHFMFNSMNSIRALIDEDPEKAKQAITMLSGILRNNLTLGRHQTIPLRDELDLVDKYLSLEKIRFEERLSVELDIDPATLPLDIPPFMLQTIVENGIKHGISKRVSGGKIIVKTAQENGLIRLAVTNSGVFRPSLNGEGIGLVNTGKRLQLLYGDNASLRILPGNEEVTVELTIPLIKYERNENAGHR